MSRFFRRANAQAQEPAAPQEPLGPETSELILRPAAGVQLPSPLEYTEDQKAKLEELEKFLRALHADSMKEDDPYRPWEQRWLNEKDLYSRYMRAAKWDLANAKKRIQGTMEWRRDFQPDLIKPDEVKIEGETGKHVISGFDKRGMPILYLRPGRENTKPSDRQIRYLVWSMERALDFCPPGQEKLCLVIDYKAATQQNNPSFETSRKVLSILQNHYVERLGRAYVSSVPWFINLFFQAIAPFLDPVTKDKIRFNTNMTDFIPAEQLDCEWKGGRYNYKFEPESYWDTLLDFCGIAKDGTRTHESYAKTAAPLLTASAAAAEQVGASATDATHLAPQASREGQTFSSFVTSNGAAEGQSQSAVAAAAATAEEDTPSSSANASAGNSGASSMRVSQNGSLQTELTEVEPAPAAAKEGESK